MLRKAILITAALTLAVIGLSSTAVSAAPSQYPPSSVPGSGVGGGNQGNQGGGNQGTGGQGAGTGSGIRSGALSRTGSDLQPFVLVGLALVAGGAFMLVTVNRRRSSASA